MKYFQIEQIQKALTDLSKERLPIAYEIARNLQLCNKVISEVSEVSRQLFEQFADRDEHGEFVRVPQEGNPSNLLMKITDPSKLSAYQQAIQKLAADEHSIPFVTISMDAIKGEKLAAETLLPLLDVILI